MENAQRNRDHYDRASWLSYDVNRMPPARQRAMILALLDGASGGSAALRNILLDPALLGAAWDAPIGKFYPDTKSPGTLNIAKMLNAFCQAEYGCHVRDAILDDGKPAGRKFVGDDLAVTGPGERPQISKNDREPARPISPKPAASTDSYDWRRIARAMGDKGWRRYYSQDELDRMI